ncbi:hypothetical protein PGTUg99_014068 [Puccinia graminis f. sp. tritici]|uniref:cysteine--tRNA ligase n=1 Tax=Puccinia graminis f. sp. tritici TaxID=56615 RepID=A0A5B0R7M0_PUCGR|nr:hypothetical protein PGTUg99_014068 [Puccinia graminis f. sp. tritici]
MNLLGRASLQLITTNPLKTNRTNILNQNRNTIRLIKTSSITMNTTTNWRAPQQSQPSGAEVSSNLRVYNSLTKSKVPFIPKEPNKITWYNCGPTVYDASHMGHARNYVTQDILRRIARDYFAYDVKFVMNVTDIDDKIIQRARQQHLLENLRSKADLITPELTDQVRQSLESYANNTVKKLLGNELSLEEVLQKAASQLQWKAEMVAKEEKFGMWIEALGSAHKALGRAICLSDMSIDNSRAEAERLIDGASEVLSKWLDQKYGSTITDHAIFKKLAVYWEKSFFDDMATLGVEPPSVLTRVSDYVEEIVEYVQKIVERGFAYVHEGSVYFDVNAFDGAEVKGHPGQQTFSHCYAKLQPGSKANKKLMEEGEGALSVNPASSTATDVKRSPADFALWKKSKPGEPGWQSVWGMGRPGWHIECSVMASAILGDGMDIHSGGVDLMFPHHDNEMAQSEAYHNCPQWVNYFLHTGHLHIEGLKMSKSLKNFITIGDALKQHSARQLRLSFIAQRWDLGMDFAESAMAEVRNQESTFNNFFAVVKALRYERSTEQMIQAIDLDQSKSVGTSHPLHAIFENARSDFHAALCDSFNTPEAMKQLLNLVTETNKYISAQIASIRAEPDGQSLLVISHIAAWISKMLRVFGLDEQTLASHPRSSTTNNRGGSDLIGWNVCDPAESKAMEYWIQWSSFRDQARKTAREKMQKKAASDPPASSAAGRLTEALNQLCQQQFRAHLLLLNLSASEHSDPVTFFGGKQVHLDHLTEPLKGSLAGQLPIWYEFWTELYRLSQASSELSPAQVLSACDQLRDEKLVEVGVALDDQDDGKALVKLLPASMLLQAREEKQRLQGEKEQKLREIKAENERKKLEKLMKGKTPPEEMFKGSTEFSRFDQNGVPTHAHPDDQEISKSKRKKFLKDWENQSRLHADYQAWVAANPLNSTQP